MSGAVSELVPLTCTICPSVAAIWPSHWLAVACLMLSGCVENCSSVCPNLMVFVDGSKFSVASAIKWPLLFPLLFRANAWPYYEFIEYVSYHTEE